MKKKGICLVLAMMLILGMVGSTALAANRPQSVVSTSVIQLFQGGINLQYERVVSPVMSFYVSPAITLATGATGFGATAGIKKYFSPTAPEGFWFGGHGNFAYVSAGGGIASGTAYGGGANVGYKYFLTDNFIIEGSLGLAYIYMSISVFGYPYAAGGTFGTTGSIRVGYAF